jgi:hypothetical protein
MTGVAGNVGLAKFVLDKVDTRESSGVCWLHFRRLNSVIAHLAIAAGSLRIHPAASGAGGSLQSIFFGFSLDLFRGGDSPAWLASLASLLSLAAFVTS